MSLKLALEWILRLAGMDYAIRDGALFVSTPELITFDVVLRIYDIRDLTTRPEDRPAPRLDLTGAVMPEVKRQFLMEVVDDYMTMGSVAELVQSRIHPDSWAAELGTTIVGEGGRLSITQRTEVHRLISELLRKLRVERTLQVRVEARLLAVSESLLAKLKGLEKPGEGTAFLKQKQLELVHSALQGGEEAKLVDAASLTCLNGQRNHTLAGRAFVEPGEKSLVQFRGTILDVRPMVSFDRKYVTMHLQLMRIEDEPVRVFKFSTTATCLDTDTVLLAGSTLPGGDGTRRLIALVTPTILHLEPAPGE